MYALCPHKQARQAARDNFNRLYHQGRRRQLWAKVTGKRAPLQELSKVGRVDGTHSRHYAGVQLVPLAQIGGSEGRTQDFDADFLPLKTYNRERWVNVEVAHRMGVTLPLVDLVQVGQLYFVRDGHHRISVAKATGQLEIEAEVTVWRCEEKPLRTNTEQVRQQPISLWSNMARRSRQMTSGAGQMFLDAANGLQSRLLSRRSIPA